MYTFGAHLKINKSVEIKQPRRKKNPIQEQDWWYGVSQIKQQN